MDFFFRSAVGVITDGMRNFIFDSFRSFMKFNRVYETDLALSSQYLRLLLIGPVSKEI